MSKSLSLLFACVSTALMIATAFTMSVNGWLVALFGLLTLLFIGWGFSLRARMIRKSSQD